MDRTTQKSWVADVKDEIHLKPIYNSPSATGMVSKVVALSRSLMARSFRQPRTLASVSHCLYVLYTERTPCRTPRVEEVEAVACSLPRHISAQEQTSRNLQPTERHCIRKEFGPYILKLNIIHEVLKHKRYVSLLNVFWKLICGS